MKSFLTRLFKRRRQPRLFREYMAFYNNQLERDVGSRYLYRHHTYHDR